MEQPLIPPDRERCQARKLYGSFMTLGPRHWERCEEKPTMILTELEPGEDGRMGSMSLCDGCLEAHHPELLKALCDVEIAEKILATVVRAL